jgi:hypothetical protein
MTSYGIYLNFLGTRRFGNFEIAGSIGPAVWFRTLSESAFALYSQSVFNRYDWGWEQTLDLFQIRTRAKTSWTGWGLNAGLSAGFRVSKNLWFVVDGLYFWEPSRQLTWSWTPGLYDGMTGNLANIAFSELAAATAEQATDAFKVKCSFWALTGGFKLRMAP